MPRKPKRPCSYPGCPKLVDGQYCEEHKRLVDKQYNEYGRDNFTKNFYKTPEWLFISQSKRDIQDRVRLAEKHRVYAGDTAVQLGRVRILQSEMA